MMFVQRQTPKLPRLIGGMHLLCWCGQGCPGVIVVLDAYTAQGGCHGLHVVESLMLMRHAKGCIDDAKCSSHAYRTAAASHFMPL